MYEPRFYHYWIKDKDLVSFKVIVKETELFVRAEKNLQRKCLKYVLKYREIIENYIRLNPIFLTTLEPYPNKKNVPSIIRDMILMSSIVNVGPMASVAGAIAEYVGKELIEYSPQIIIENGGDIFIKTNTERLIGIYAGEKSPFTGKIALKIYPEETPLGICTSSGTVGHSLSFGTADAVTVISKSAILADAAATAVANIVKEKTDIDKAIEYSKGIKGIRGVVIIKDDKLALYGDIEITNI